MKIKNYAESPAIKLTDKIICSDGVTGETKNIEVGSIVGIFAWSVVQALIDSGLDQKQSRSLSKSVFGSRGSNGTTKDNNFESTVTGTESSNSDEVTNYTKFLTGATVGKRSGKSSVGYMDVPINSNPDMECVIKTGTDVSSQLIMVGFTGDEITMSNVQGKPFIGFRYNTDAPDLGFVGTVNDQTTQTYTTVFENIAVRWQIVKRLAKGEHHQSIAEDLHLGVATVTRGSREMRKKEGGLRRALKIVTK